MTLQLLTRRKLCLQRATTAPGPSGEIIRVWQTLLSAIPASILTLHAHEWKTIARRGMDITHVIITPQNTGAEFGDRLFDGVLYYGVEFVSNLGDRDQAWAIYAGLLDPQDSRIES
ncbi:MAG: hypothetical protein ACP5I8_04965 [Phycisphaerae bacterium]